MNTTCENAPESKEYLDFVEKFKPKKIRRKKAKYCLAAECFCQREQPQRDGRFQNASSKSLED